MLEGLFKSGDVIIVRYKVHEKSTIKSEWKIHEKIYGKINNKNCSCKFFSFFNNYCNNGNLFWLLVLKTQFWPLYA